MRIPAYERLHCQSRRESSRAQLLVAHMNGGWGNRFYTLMGALPLAIALDRALLIVSEESSMNMAMEPNRIDWRSWNVSSEYPPKRTNLDVTILNLTEYTSLYQFDVIHVFVPQLKNPYETWSPLLQRLAAERGIPLKSLRHRDVFHFLFRAARPLQQKVAQLQSVLSSKEEPYLAMHIRTGGDESDSRNPNNVWFVNSTAAMNIMPKMAMMAIQSHGFPHTTKWLVATDSLELGMSLSKAYPRNIVLSNTDLPLTNGLHIDKGGSKEGAVITFVDWLLLANADVFLQAGSSSFSTSARLYRNSSCIHMNETLPSAVKVGHQLPIL